MTPKEVGGLQALAQAQGGSLTINPHTGLPEAGILGSILPMILGAAATFLTGGALAPWVAPLVIGAGTGAIKGDLMAGLTAGLGAFGGVGLAGAAMGAGAGAAGAATNAATNVAANSAGALAPLGEVAPALAEAGASTAGMGAAGVLLPTGSSALSAITPTAAPSLAGAGAGAGAGAAPAAGGLFKGALGNFGSNFESALAGPLGSGAAPSAMSTGLGTMGVISSVGGAMQPKGPKMPEDTDVSHYRGPYLPAPRQVSFPTNRDPNDSSEYSFFEPSNPYPGYVDVTEDPQQYNRVTFADGGAVPTSERDYGFKPAWGAPGQSNYIGPASQYGGLSGVNDISSLLANLVNQGGFGSGLAGMAGLNGLISQYASQNGATPTSAWNSMPGNQQQTSTTPTMAPIRRPPPGEVGLPAAKEFDYGFKPMWGQQPTAGNASPPLPGAPATSTSTPNSSPQSPYSVSPYAPPYQYNSVLQQLMNNGQTGSSFPMSFAAGGETLRDGAFIVDARTVSELGNGSSGAGQELLAQYGGQPIRGPGDGVSDSIHANIGGLQEARIARDEVKFDPEAVARIGRGNPEQGAKKLYALMEKAHKARRAAKPGQDTKVRGALKR
tara:strand:- start:46 stop:1875 length:1830 start_codon:yes stop_codon:yes gene_type:complete